MDYFPVFLDLKNRKCLVVGGGTVALRKVESLTGAGAAVTVVAEEVLDGIRRLAPAVHIVNRAFAPDDVTADCVLVVAATDDPKVNASVAQIAQRRNALCNVVDEPRLCSCIIPAVLERGKVIAAVSTSGSSPVLAAFLRDRLSGVIGEEYAAVADFCAQIRPQIHAYLTDAGERHRFWKRYISDALVQIFRNEGGDGLRRAAHELLRAGFGVRI